MIREKSTSSGRTFLELSTILAFLTALTIQASSPPKPRDLDQVLQELEDYTQTIWDPAKVPGVAYAVVKGSETVYARGFGYRDKDASSGPVDEHTLFEIGSCTKAFNAAVLGTVVDEGKVAWTDKVQTQLPEFKMYDAWVAKEFLIGDLMAQRSGMPQYALDNMSVEGFSREDIKRAIPLVEPVTSFRSGYAYQNNLHLWAAELIEKKTGLTWEEAVRRRILEPLGMSESTFDFATYDASPNHTLGHIPQSDNSLWTIPPGWPYRGWLSVYAPAGGLCSNVTDMGKWVALQLGNGTYAGKVILKPETVQAIRAPRIYMGIALTGVASYAMGWIYQSSPQSPWYWHNGGTTGMHSLVAFYPECDLGLVVLTNTSDNKIPECMAQALLALYYGLDPRECPRAEAGSSPGERKEACASGGTQETSAVIPPSKLAGAYSNPAYGKAVVKKQESGLTMSLGPAKRLGQLTPVEGNKYSFQWPEWPGRAPSTVLFKADASGNVTKLTMSDFVDVRGGEFKKVSP